MFETVDPQSPEDMCCKDKNELRHAFYINLMNSYRFKGKFIFKAGHFVLYSISILQKNLSNDERFYLTLISQLLSIGGVFLYS